VPALIELLGGIVPALALLGACLGFAFATGAIYTWEATFHQVLKWLAAILPGAVRVVGKTILPDMAGAVRSADVAVQDYLKAWRKGAEIEIALSIHLLKLVWQAQAEAVDWLGRETAKTFDYLIHIRVPKVVRYAVPFSLTPFLLRKIVNAVLPHIHIGTVKIVHTIEHTISTATTTIIRKSVGGLATIPPWVIRLPHRVGRAERDLTKLSHRLRKVEGIFAAGVFAAVLANALGVATRCIRRGNLGRGARAACATDPNLFESLLVDLVAITSVLSVVEFAQELLAVEDEAIHLAGTMIREFPS